MMSSFILSAYSLWKREMVRFYRQPSRIVGAIGSPLIFWLLIGSGLRNSFKGGGATGPQNYLQYFFPGTILMVIFFTAIFSTISLIEDRREGFLQSVLVAPIPRSGFVFGKILGGTTLAALQGLIFLAFAPFVGIHLGGILIAKSALTLFLNGFMLTALGFLIAWQFDSIQGFHAVMNLFLLPLWILSGALFPAEGASQWIRLIMKLNPLSYGLNALRSAVSSESSAPYFLQSFLIASCFAVVFFAAATWNARGSRPS